MSSYTGLALHKVFTGYVTLPMVWHMTKLWEYHVVQMQEAGVTDRILIMKRISSLSRHSVLPRQIHPGPNTLS